MSDFYHDRLGYKGHIAEDPASEIITATAVTSAVGTVGVQGGRADSHCYLAAVIVRDVWFASTKQCVLNLMAD
jgi:hypothetical protein